NIYRNLLTDWLSYADSNGLDRESAFFHVTQETAFTGDSASSQPVNWFWNVSLGADGNWADLTSPAHSVANSFTLGGQDQSLALGYTEKSGEVNLRLLQGASAGWQGTWEYVTATDANGNPTQWQALPLVGDGTAGLTRSGRVTFDPPKDWVPASVNGSDRLYFVRLRTTQDGGAPVVNTVLGRD